MQKDLWTVVLFEYFFNYLNDTFCLMLNEISNMQQYKTSLVFFVTGHIPENYINCFLLYDIDQYNKSCRIPIIKRMTSTDETSTCSTAIVPIVICCCILTIILYKLY